MVYTNLRNLYFNPVARQIFRDYYNQLTATIDSILSGPKNKLITALTFLITGIPRVSLAKNVNYKKDLSQSSQQVVGFPTNPFNCHEYMEDLANRLSEEGRDILLSGIDVPKPVEKYRAPAVKLETEKPYEEPQKRALVRVPKEEPQIPSKQKLEYASWSIGNDLEKYRKHAVEEGSRNSAENLKNALSHIGLTIEDLANLITLAYASDRGKQFRENDGKDPFWQAGKTLEQGGITIANITDGGYSIIDLTLLDSLPNIEKDAYQNNHPLVRPFVFTGSTIGSACKTVENVGNVPTCGLFDNLTGSAGMCIEDIVESLKHTGEAGTNLTRGAFYLVFGKSENLDKILDWPTLVIFEYSSNVIEMKGISNMQDYKNAFRDKGVIGPIAELLGSGYLAIRSIDELIEELEDEPSKKKVVAEEQGQGPPKPPFEQPETLLKPPIPPFPRPPYNCGGWYTIIIYTNG